MILQECFHRLDAGEGHSDIDGETSPGSIPPEVQLRNTEARTVSVGQRHQPGQQSGRAQEAVLALEALMWLELRNGYWEQRKSGGAWELDKVQDGQEMARMEERF